MAKGETSITVYSDWCKGCGLCAAFCPKHVFDMDASGKAVAARPEDCVNCGFCEPHCPDFALSVQSKDKLPGAHPANGANGAGHNGAAKEVV